jgi:hypothetical protein
MGVFMRVATFVLGIALTIVGGASEAADVSGSSNGAAPSVALADNVLPTPVTERFITPNTSAWLSAQEGSLRNHALGAMGFVPSQGPTSATRTRPFGAAPQPQRPYNPATTPLPRTRTLEDHLLTGFVALMLIAYQLRRKHRFLRPHQFSI